MRTHLFLPFLAPFLSITAVHGQGGCDAPIAVIAGHSDGVIRACQFEEATYDGSGSSAAPGHTIVSYTWHSDPSLVLTGPTPSHTFDSYGVHRLVLEVMDETGCTARDSVDIHVPPPPILQLSPDHLYHCVDAAVRFVADPTSLPFTEGTQLLAAQNEGSGPMVATVIYDHFPENATLASSADIQSVCLDLEHSFLGDLQIDLTCPSGQTMRLENYLGNEAVQVGAPVDTDDEVPLYGECWHYCFSPLSENGTWDENTAWSNIIPNGSYFSIPPGTYEASSSWEPLVGCPLNGTWTLTITDVLASDNGFFCGWQLNFAGMAEQPSATTGATLAPTIGADCDSSYWTSTYPLDLLALCDTAYLSGAPLGPHTLTYNVVDNYGCAYYRDLPIILIDVASVSITGDPMPEAGDTEVYTASATNGQYQWSAIGGTVQYPSFQSSATVVWSSPEGGSVTLDYSLDGCTTSVTLPVTSVGLAETVPPRSPLLYPVPADAFLEVHSPDAVRAMHIHDALGRTVALPKTTPSSRDLRIDTSNFPDGIYILQLETLQGPSAVQFVVQH